VHLLRDIRATSRDPRDRRVSADPLDAGRRNFLIRSCQGLAASLVPAGLHSLALRSFPASKQISPDNEFHVHPHYRSQVPLDALLLKAKAGLDNFVTEKYADQLAAILAEWTSNLLQSPQQLQAIERALSPNFEGTSSRPSESRLIRSAPPLEICQNRFRHETTLGRDAFLREFRSSLSPFSKIVTAEFQVISIQASTPEGGSSSSSVSHTLDRLQTRVRYELIGSGLDFYREQRVGYWDLEWQPVSSSEAAEFRVWRWYALEETCSRSAHPVFLDITAQALVGNSSYGSQLLHGTDHWRTVLDGACGIDIYGHNGISVGDIDNDGFDDLYICQPAGLPNRLYRNRGDGTFEDITEKSGVGLLENTACALFTDINNDGHQDLIVVRTNGPLLLLNEGGGKFRSMPNAFKFASKPQGTFTGAAIADYDRDGWLDIYFCLYIYYQGAEQYKYPTPYYDAENGPPNFMMRNNRDGTFSDVTAESHLDRNNTRYSFCCGWSDYNGDGWPDLYVVNDFGRKNLYRNNGNGTFTDVAPQAGVEDVGAGMSVCWFDYDTDSARYLYVADMWTAAGKRIATQEIFQKDAPENVRALYRKHAMGNSLFRNTGSGNFRDVSAAAGVEMGRWSWSSDAWDFDHDCFPDLYIANGMISGPSREDLNSFFWRQVVAHSPAEAKPSHDYEQGWNAINELIRSDGTWSGFERNVFYANNHDGTFSDVSGAVGLDFIEDGRSFALADFDHDGRLEVFLKNRNAPQLRLLKNVAKDLPPSIAFRLQGTKSNRDAIGAVVTVETESGRQTRMLQAGSGFLSQHSKEIFFGLGNAKGSVRASIRWPSALVQELKELPLNHCIWVEEGSTPARVKPFKEQRPGQVATFERQEQDALPTAVETWLLAPVAAPDFSLRDLANQTRTLASFHGKPVLLNFWTTQSLHCEEDMKVFHRLNQRWTAEGLQLLTVNVEDSRESERVRAWARQRGYSYPILQRSDDTTGIYDILYRYLFDRHRDLGLPTSFLIDDKGNIVKVYQGPLNAEHVEHDFQHIPQSFAERLALALPFPGFTENTEFQRNCLSYGSVYFQRGYYDQAEASFQNALRDDPSSAEALYGLGSVYLLQQKNKEARECFERTIKMRASYPGTLPNAWNNLGLLATREGRTAEAIPYFQDALRLDPDHPIALVNLGNAYRQQKQWEQARAPLEHALELSPEDPEANYSLAMVFAQMNDTKHAYEYLQRALQFRPAYPEALNNLGILYLRTGRRDQAIANFEECIRVAPAFDQAYLNLARVYVVEGTPQKARDVLRELLKQHPDHAQAQNMLQELQRP
jgi:tetratricopeptide (TPR) repeat protein